ncbi:DUF998 domain-containing protein [Amycolatopsis sp. 195334CR]|uniref:DUF998 domain-containing protein n=1 Tax=Amycolatopsis sp. 195334CR TaxID=2814588 RepID=UPI001A8F0AE2|nr:DUF998 domain-containing protein [Amycolatopsis sp. 195334CR]MBN6039496.1 DUF998 domain-containing protein [Amycolatopsis sp. 195334CR]
MHPTASVQTPQMSFVHSYLFLRRAVGVIGLALPVVLIVGKIVLEGGGTLSSISGYYHSVMRGVFVGSMCAVGTFLLSYRGYNRLDDICGDIAAVAAIGVGLFPVAGPDPTPTQRLVETVHVACAAVFFVTLAVFCLFLFTRTGGEPTRHKTWRNRVYRTCGLVMLACLVLIAAEGLWLADELAALNPVLWLESAAIFAFGVAWWIKGETLLRDP